MVFDKGTDRNRIPGTGEDRPGRTRLASHLLKYFVARPSGVERLEDAVAAAGAGITTINAVEVLDRLCEDGLLVKIGDREAAVYWLKNRSLAESFLARFRDETD